MPAAMKSARIVRRDDLGRLGAESSMARRHGRHARSGRGSEAGRPKAHLVQRENWAEKHAERDAYIHELDGKLTHLTSKTKRAKTIKRGWPIAEGREPGLDEWTKAHNVNLADEEKIRPLSVDTLTRMLRRRG